MVSWHVRWFVLEPRGVRTTAHPATKEEGGGGAEHQYRLKAGSRVRRMTVFVGAGHGSSAMTTTSRSTCAGEGEAAITEGRQTDTAASANESA